MIGQLFTLKQIEALVWVADLGSFRKAAEHLNTTQPNISARIAGLEGALGLVLMHRGRGRVRMTDAGQEVLNAARAMLRQAEAVAAASGRPELAQGRIRLGVTEMIAGTWLHAYLRRMQEVLPSVRVELTVDLAVHLDAALGRSELDIAIQSAPFRSEASGCIEIGSYPYVWVTTPGIAVGLGRRSTLADLVAHDVLTHARHTEAYGQLTRHAAALGIPASRFAASSSLTACAQMVRDGMGIGLLPRALMAAEIESGALVELGADWHPDDLRFAVRYHRDKAGGTVTRAAELAAESAEGFR